MLARRKRTRSLKARRSKFSDQQITVLIVCEGEKTEPQYFKHWWRECKRSVSANIEIISDDACGTDAKSIVEYAKDKKAIFDYDEIWCVFDRDENPPDKLKAALNQARDNDLNIAFSNPCFELWFLLHFQDQTAHIERDQAERTLRRKYIKGYEKSLDVYGTILPGQAGAIARARDLRKLHHDNGNDKRSNPSTTADKLVRYLNSLTPRS